MPGNVIQLKTIRSSNTQKNYIQKICVCLLVIPRATPHIHPSIHSSNNLTSRQTTWRNLRVYFIVSFSLSIHIYFRTNTKARDGNILQISSQIIKEWNGKLIDWFYLFRFHFDRIILFSHSLCLASLLTLTVRVRLTDWPTGRLTAIYNPFKTARQKLLDDRANWS